MRHATIASVSLGMLLAFGALPAFPQSPDATSNSRQRSDADMRLMLEKLTVLGAKPLGTLSVEDTRRGPTPAAAVKGILRDQGKDPAPLSPGN